MDGVWSVQGFSGEVSRTVCHSLLDEIPNFANAATEAVIQPCNTQWGKSLLSNGNKTAFCPEVNICLQILVDKSVPLYVREQAVLQHLLESLSCHEGAKELFAVWELQARVPTAICWARKLCCAEGAFKLAVSYGWKPPQCGNEVLGWREKAARPRVRFLLTFPSFTDTGRRNHLRDHW